MREPRTLTVALLISRRLITHAINELSLAQPTEADDPKLAATVRELRHSLLYNATMLDQILAYEAKHPTPEGGR